MKTYLMTLIAVLSLCVALGGCAATETTTKAEPGTATAGATAELAKCDTCGKEFPKADLHNHGGKLVCSSCDSH